MRDWRRGNFQILLLGIGVDRFTGVNSTQVEITPVSVMIHHSHHGVKSKSSILNSHSCCTLLAYPPIVISNHRPAWMTLLDAFGIYLQECHIEIFWSDFIDGHEWQVMTIFLPTLLPPDLTQFTRYNRHKDFSMMSDQKGSITNDLVKFSQSSHHHKVLPPSGKCRSLNLQWLGWLGSPSGIGNLPPRVNSNDIQRHHLIPIHHDTNIQNILDIMTSHPLKSVNFNNPLKINYYIGTISILDSDKSG